jgi:hypothetical protein
LDRKLVYVPRHFGVPLLPKEVEIFNKYCGPPVDAVFVSWRKCVSVKTKAFKPQDVYSPHNVEAFIFSSNLP